MDDTMRIDAPQGTKVIFTATNGLDGELKRAKEQLTMGETYTVEYTDIGNWKTNVYLREVPNVPFNSVHFVEVTEELEENSKEWLEKQIKFHASQLELCKAKLEELKRAEVDWMPNTAYRVDVDGKDYVFISAEEVGYFYEDGAFSGDKHPRTKFEKL